jgi:OmpA-OmpF porin, OOP family
MRLQLRIISIALGLGIMLGEGAALAQTTGTPSESDISRSLAPKSRGLPYLGDLPPSPGNPAIAPTSTGPAPPKARVKQPTTQVSAPDAHPSATLRTIQFEFGSAQLTPGSIETLKNLGNALNNELKDQPQFRIEGHTDAYGEASLNDQLSNERAEAVKDYLVKQMGVAENRLQAVGKGSSEPVQGASPYSAVNRRVVVVNTEG